MTRLSRVGPLRQQDSSSASHFNSPTTSGPYNSTRTWTGLPKCCMHSTLGNTKFYSGGLSNQFSPLALAAVFLQSTSSFKFFYLWGHPSIDDHLPGPVMSFPRPK